jgi:TrmH family RNA methyltransferase
LSDTKNGQGIVVLADQPATPELESLVPAIGSVPIVLYLKNAGNPSNLGAVIRTAEAAGVAGLMVSPGSTDPYSAKAVRASMGSSFRLPIVKDMEFEDARAWAKKSGLITTAADISAAVGYTVTDWRKPRLLVLGSEAHGLDPSMLDSLDELTLIQMENDVESLNLAVACGIILFEAKRQNAA